MRRLLQRHKRPSARANSAEELIPPPEVLPKYIKPSAFKERGEMFLETAREKGLRPDHGVLDLGCGVGRFAVALFDYLDDEGRYVGLDTDKQSIALCKEWIEAKDPRFTFVWADVFNTHYNREAKARADRYRFPFEDATFDFVFSNSLFTHLVPEDAENYIEEIGRVLKPQGRTLNTMFLLNAESRTLVDSGESRQGVVHEFAGVARVKKPQDPEAWIAIEEEFIRDAHARAGLEIEDVRYGGWSGRESTGPGFGRKDIVLAVAP